jgi:hypothetical protein
MEDTLEFKLVKGEFTPEEAGKILFSLIQNKINYHNVEILSRQIRFGFGDDVSHSEKRVADLKKINKSLIAFLKEADAEGKKLEINGTFELSVVE